MRWEQTLLAAAEQYRGLVPARVLDEIGLSIDARGRLIRRGVLRPVYHRRVYALGDVALDFEGRARAASLAVPGGWVSGVTAGRLWRLRGMPIHRLELTVPTASRPRLDGVRVRRTCLEQPDVVDQLDGLRLSSVAQTLFELSYELDDMALRSAHESALERRIVTPAELAEIGSRAVRVGRNGSEKFRRVVLERNPELPAVMSRDELVLLDALGSAGLDMERQFSLILPGGRPIRLDGARPEVRFGLEVDGDTHERAINIQRDKHRDIQAATINWEVLRPTTADVRTRLGLTVRWILQAYTARRHLFGLAP